MSSLLLTNLYWVLPEVLLSLLVTFLLGYGVILSKFGKAIFQYKKTTWLSIISLFFVASLLIEQLITISSSGLSEPILIGGGFLVANEFIIGIKLLSVLSTLLILILSLRATIDDKIVDYEFSHLIILSLLGMLLLVSSRDFLMFYLAIELLSLSFYVLAGTKKHSQHSTEAALKYFLLGALASGLLLFGIAVIYAYTGTTNFSGVSQFIWYTEGGSIGALFIIIALLFKIAAAPFHSWAPDVYEGSPTIVTAFFAIVPKLATISVLIILLNGPFIGIFSDLQPILIFSAVCSLLVGSIAAINQAKMKRLLAYSSISHVGFLLCGILTNSILSLQATFIYLIIYIVMSINTWTLVLTIFKHGNYITQLSGLSRTNPVLGMTFVLVLFSIAGVPPLAGFFSKYLILLELVNNSYYVLAFIAVMCSSIAGFYYLRVIRWMFFKHNTTFHLKDIGDVLYPSNTNLGVSFTQSIFLGATLWLVLTLLLFPNLLLTFSSKLLVTAFI
jgi:NADH-quinone oxidoreductase subunit N